MSNKQIAESESSGKESISPIKFFANTVLPAPMKVIFLAELLIRFSISSVLRFQAPCPRASPRRKSLQLAALKLQSIEQAVNLTIYLFER